MKQVCLYHRSDLDGHCSAAIVKHFRPDAELIGVEYGDEILTSEKLWTKLKGADVCLVDFSLQPWSEMQRLSEEADAVLWIDHHRSAISLYHKEGVTRPTDFVAFLREGTAACELCWEYFSQIVMPRAVYLLGRYDVWDHTDPDTLPFQYGMRLNDTDPSRAGQDGVFPWGDVLHIGGDEENFLSATLEQGQTIIEYQRQENAKLMKVAFLHEWKEYTWLAVNAGGINSLACKSVFDPTKHDGFMSFFFGGKKWKVSLYSPDQAHDFEFLAQEMDGGGHPAACGFMVENLKEIGLITPEK